MNQMMPSWQRAFHLMQVGDDNAAFTLALDLVERRPGPEVFEIAASLAARRGDLGEATILYRKGVALYPGDFVLAVNAARLIRQEPEGVAEALAILEAYLAQHPDNAAANQSRVETLRMGGRLAEADAAVCDHIARFPRHPGGYLSHALVLFDQQKLYETLKACERAASFSETAFRAHEIAANAHVVLGDVPQALANYRAALRIAHDPDLHSRLLVSMMYCDTLSVAEIHAEAKSWVDTHMAGIPTRAHWPDIDPNEDRRLRVGFVSGDFRLCSTPLLLYPLWCNLPTRWDVVLYDTAPSGDLWSERFRAASAGWRDISCLSDDETCDLITDDRIDVLFDLNGHTLGGRPGIFHRKPAPVQIAWMNFVGTRGLRSFDAIIGDAHHIPLAEQHLYAEPIRHIRDNLYCYLPPADATEVGPLPASRTGNVTFGCFNAPYKLSPSVLDLWSSILMDLPGSRLLLSSREYGCADTRERLRRAFAGRGIDEDRIVLRPGASTPGELMANYSEVDIALDPFPYSGGLTTLEALFMGVPVVTMPGDRFGSRHSMAHLQVLGLADWVAGDADAYKKLALERATDLTQLAHLRSHLRGRLAASPLCDGSRVARGIDEIASDLWARHCREYGAAS